MIVYPNCKINLGLKVLAKRKDGFHNLESVFVPIPLYDVMEIIEQKSEAEKILFSSSGLPIEGETHSNLCVKAYHLLDSIYKLPSIKMHLHKLIPMGAGLGGGSSDAAFTLKLLNQIFQLKMPVSELRKYAVQLGSDCPFFINNHSSYVTGRGENLKKFDLDLKGLFLLIIYPGIHISTADAFQNLHFTENKFPIAQINSWKKSSWRKRIVNDFEVHALSKYPQLHKIKETLYNNGAIYSGMSGSGSSIYGLFETKPTIPKSLQGYFTFAHELE